MACHNNDSNDRNTNSAVNFLQLPPEIRNAVYLELLTLDIDNSTVKIEPFRRTFKATKHGNSVSFACQDLLAPLLICRQVRDEAESYFYYHHRFSFATPFEAVIFLQGIGKRRRRFIRDVVLPCTIEPLICFGAELYMRSLLLLVQSEHLSSIKICVETEPNYLPLSPIWSHEIQMLIKSLAYRVTQNFQGLTKVAIVTSTIHRLTGQSVIYDIEAIPEIAHLVRKMKAPHAQLSSRRQLLNTAIGKEMRLRINKKPLWFCCLPYERLLLWTRVPQVDLIRAILATEPLLWETMQA